MEEAIQKVEKYFGRMCSEVGSVTRKTARLRDKFDLLAKVIVLLKMLTPLTYHMMSWFFNRIYTHVMHISNILSFFSIPYIKIFPYY